MDFKHAERYMSEQQALDARIASALPEARETEQTPKQRFADIGKKIGSMPGITSVGQHCFVNVNFGQDKPRLTLHAEYQDTEDTRTLTDVMAKWTYYDPSAPIGHDFKLLGLPERLLLDDLNKQLPEAIGVLGLIEESVDAAASWFELRGEERAA